MEYHQWLDTSDTLCKGAEQDKEGQWRTRNELAGSTKDRGFLPCHSSSFIPNPSPLPSPTPQSQARVLHRQIQKQRPLRRPGENVSQAKFLQIYSKRSLSPLQKTPPTQVFFFFFSGCVLRHEGSQCLDQESKACPLHWEYRASATGPPGKSQHQISLNGASTDSPGSLGLFKSNTRNFFLFRNHLSPGPSPF